MGVERKMFCYHCQKPVEGKVSFRDECLHCQADLHICLNCRFYDPSFYNECKESLAERVKEKDRNNRCEYFAFATNGAQKKSALDQKREDLLKSAEALFKKP